MVGTNVEYACSPIAGISYNAHIALHYASLLLPIPHTMSPIESPYKSKGGLGRLFNALRYSLQGLRAAFRHEAAFRQELLLTVVLVPVAFWLSRSLGELLLLLGTLVFLLVVELFNSALEALADAITLDHHPLIGRAKDLGSAAVMLALVFGAVVWASLLIMRFMPA